MRATQELTRYQQRRLELAPERATRFLKAVAGSAALQRALRPHGFTPAEFDRGKALLFDSLGGLPEHEPTSPEDAEVERARNAFTELSQTDQGIHARISAALDHHFAAISARVFAGIKPGTGAAAIGYILALTARLAALRGTEEGRKALALLATRGFPAAEIERLRRLANLALGAPEAGEADEADEAAEPIEDPAEAEGAEGAAEAIEAPADTRHVATVGLLAWLTEWSIVARSVIKRRDLLISLGLLERRSGKREAVDLPE